MEEQTYRMRHFDVFDKECLENYTESVRWIVCMDIVEVNDEIFHCQVIKRRVQQVKRNRFK